MRVQIHWIIHRSVFQTAAPKHRPSIHTENDSPQQSKHLFINFVDISRCLSARLLHRFPLRNVWLAARALRWAENYTHKKKEKEKDHLSVCCKISSHREKYAVGVSNQRVRRLQCDYEALFASVTRWWPCLRSPPLISDKITDLLLNWLM